VDRPVLDEESCAPVPSDRCVPSDGSVTLESFRLLSEEEVRALVIASPKQYCDLDPMPMPLVIDCLELLLPVITHLVNSSLIYGYFPSDWKEALVKPLLKKPGQAALFNHLRPISNLQFISKPAEQAVYDQIYDHLMLHDLFPEYQSAYRQGYCTETALLKVQNDILLNMDCQQVTLLVLLDLSAAFDTVDHSILLYRLETSFGITGTVRKWFESYLSGRCQRIAFKDGISDIFPLTCGVPQGSCLGPLLFTMYASKLFDVIKEHLPTAHAYADDTQLYFSFKPGNGASEEGHWLPVKERIIFKISVLTFKAIHGLAPSYVSEMVTVMRPSSYQLRRNKELLTEPANNRNTKKTLGDRAFSFAAPTVFNALPHFIRQGSNFNSFKSSLKTYTLHIVHRFIRLS
jgi:hypothetical protein